MYLSLSLSPRRCCCVVCSRSAILSRTISYTMLHSCTPRRRYLHSAGVKHRDCMHACMHTYIHACIRIHAQRLRYLHSAGIYHRDLKPANCLVNQDDIILYSVIKLYLVILYYIVLHYITLHYIILYSMIIIIIIIVIIIVMLVMYIIVYYIIVNQAPRRWRMRVYIHS